MCYRHREILPYGQLIHLSVHSLEEKVTHHCATIYTKLVSSLASLLLPSLLQSNSRQCPMKVVVTISPMSPKAFPSIDKIFHSKLIMATASLTKSSVHVTCCHDFNFKLYAFAFASCECTLGFLRNEQRFHYVK